MLPLVHFVETAFGSSRNAIFAAVQQARFDSTSRCLQQVGFKNLEPSPDQLMTVTDEPAVFIAAEYLAEIEEGRVTQDYDTEAAASPAYQSAAARCRELSEQSIVNPLAAFDAWVAENITSLNARTLSSDTYLAATHAYVDCLKRAGLDPTSADQLRVSYATRANGLLDEFAAGPDPDGAVQQLRALAESEARDLSPIKACDDALQDVWFQVRFDLETEFVELHAAAMVDALDRGREALVSLQEYLSAR